MHSDEYWELVLEAQREYWRLENALTKLYKDYLQHRTNCWKCMFIKCGTARAKQTLADEMEKEVIKAYNKAWTALANADNFKK